MFTPWGSVLTYSTNNAQFIASIRIEVSPPWPLCTTSLSSHPAAAPSQDLKLDLKPRDRYFTVFFSLWFQMYFCVLDPFLACYDRISISAKVSDSEVFLSNPWRWTKPSSHYTRPSLLVRKYCKHPPSSCLLSFAAFLLASRCIRSPYCNSYLVIFPFASPSLTHTCGLASPQQRR